MRGTVSNLVGKFEITLDSSNYSIKFSYIGYENKILPVSKTDKSVLIELAPKPINMKTVVIYPYSHTWEERFILRAIDKKKQFKEKLHYYTALAYSKTSFSFARSNTLFAMLEAVSDITYQAPDLYKEKVVSLQMPVHMKNIPYQAISINQEVDLYNHSVNDPLNKPYVDVNQLVSVEPNLTYQIGLNRDAMFRMPLSDKEVQYQELVDRVFNHAPLHRRIILLLISNVYPLILDQSASESN